MSSSIHVDSVKLVPASLPLDNVCAESGSGRMASKPRIAAAFTPFCNWETNAQISAWKRVIFANTSNFHYRRPLSFLYSLTAMGQLWLFLHDFSFLWPTTDIQSRDESTHYKFNTYFFGSPFYLKLGRLPVQIYFYRTNKFYKLNV